MNYDVDYYQILGLDKTATAEEIKKKFRSLARECHPDRAGTSPEAIERFSKIREAYEVLGSPELRLQYDNPPVAVKKAKTLHRKTWRPPTGMRSHGMSSTSTARNKRGMNNEKNQINLDDILSVNIGAGRPKTKPSRLNQQTYRRENAVDGEDISIDVSIPSNIAHRGGSVMVEYKRLIRGENLSLVQIDEIQYLRVGENTQYGDLLRVPKLGHAGANGGSYGDLICRIQIAGPAHREETSSSQHVESERNILLSISEAVLGGRIEVETSMGRKTISIPPCTSSGKKLRIRNGGEKGEDLLLTVQIVIPKELDAESKELIRKFAERNPISPR